MLAEHLGRFERRVAREPALVPAAVTVAVLSGPDEEACFVLTRRASGLRRHGGQWALPGGRLDPGESAVEAALRELAEEVGLRAGTDAVIGVLDDYPTRSGFSITPVVVWIECPGKLQPDPREVAAAYRVPLSDLEAPEVPHLRTIRESDRPVIGVPLLGTLIHAPTAAILYQVREVALWGRSTRVDHFEQPVFAWR